jgi:fructose-1,6-bisphosphatase/inositol monophosphatase family enzyme
VSKAANDPALEALRSALDGYLRQLALEVPRLRDEGWGRDVLGPVAGRTESEDVEIGLDRFSEDLLQEWLERCGTDVDLYSEHSRRRIGGSGTAPFLITCDPFDGSGHFMRGLPAEWWGVLTVWERSGSDLTPIMAGAIDINRRELYKAEGSVVTVEALETGEVSEVRPSQAQSLSQDSIIAAYLMSPQYIRAWTSRSAGLLEAMEREYPEARLWADGGACSYPWLARGLTHAYVMYDEPRTEIDPGLGFASAGGFVVYSVSPEGDLEPYRFEPERSAERVPWLIAACTEALARDLARLVAYG